MDPMLRLREGITWIALHMDPFLRLREGIA